MNFKNLQNESKLLEVRIVVTLENAVSGKRAQDGVGDGF